ncbi:MAG TPA: alkaline phosphatase family protein, partial [bacterium]|nr:alkaline phosphatase family protein [bacterium]
LRMTGPGSAVCFSAERAHEATLAEHGVQDARALVGWPTPEVYSSTLSEFVMEAGVRLLEAYQPDVMYLSLTDYIQHKHAPGDPVADAFYRGLDGYWGRLAARGCVVGLTADHGMNGKTLPNGQPNIIYLESLARQWLPQAQMRVILPITDPYVLHHGALGSFATLYARNPADVLALRERLQATPGIVYCEERQRACARFQLPPDRMGDLVVVSGRNVVLGKSPEAHDLSLLKEPLRSHGGLAEQQVPFVLSARLNAAYRARLGPGLRNFDLFDFAVNGAA